MAFDFEYDVVFDHATVLDVDAGEVSFVRVLDAGLAPLAEFPLADLGDNSVQTVGAPVFGVRRIEIHLGGSGALAEIVACPDSGKGPGAPQ
jgi:hypothetical protein